MVNLTAEEKDERIAHFCRTTGADATQARQLLELNDWIGEGAVMEYYLMQEDAERDAFEGEDPEDMSEDDLSEEPRTLGGEPATGTSASGQRKDRPQRKKFATLGDLTAGEAAGDASDSDDPPQDFFAGGEKSGLAVQNPDDLKRKILEKAKRGIPGGTEEPQPRTGSHFRGTARTLGGDDAPSRVIDDPSARRPAAPERISRVLHFWNDGFSIDDGDLYRSDDPLNAQILNGIRQGRAPLSIMNVQPGQEVDVNILQHDTDYVKPKAKYKPFGGQGQRLGSPTPGPGPRAAPAAATATAATETGPEKPSIDESQPTVTLQIRLGDGSRLSARFNTSNTIGDVYDFVMRANPANRTRSWVLMTTFPSTELKDKGVALGDLQEFRRGGVVVQKWT